MQKDDPAALRSTPVLLERIEVALQRLQSVTEADISAYLLHLGQGLKPATISRRLTPLRLFFQRLQRYHLIAINPMEDIQAPEVSSHSTTVYLSRHKARRLEEECQGPTLRDLRDHALIVTMLSTGLRAAEVIAIAWDYLGTRDGHRVVTIAGKGNQRARIKLKPQTWEVLQRYLEALGAIGINRGPVLQRLRHCAPIRRNLWHRAATPSMRRSTLSSFSTGFWRGSRRSVRTNVIAIDGKPHLGSHARSTGKAALYLVSAWDTNNRLGLRHVAVDSKSNEITAIPHLLDLLDLRNCTVTIDALG